MILSVVFHPLSPSLFISNMWKIDKLKGPFLVSEISSLDTYFHPCNTVNYGDESDLREESTETTSWLRSKHFCDVPTTGNFLELIWSSFNWLIVCRRRAVMVLIFHVYSWTRNFPDFPSFIVLLTYYKSLQQSLISKNKDTLSLIARRLCWHQKHTVFVPYSWTYIWTYTRREFVKRLLLHFLSHFCLKING